MAKKVTKKNVKKTTKKPEITVNTPDELEINVTVPGDVETEESFIEEMDRDLTTETPSVDDTVTENEVEDLFEVDEEGAIVEDDTEESYHPLRWSFMTTLNNIRFAEDLVMNNLTTTIFECDALSLDDAVSIFLDLCRALFTRAQNDQQIVSVLKIMFGKKIRVMHRPIDNDEFDYVEL